MSETSGSWDRIYELFAENKGHGVETVGGVVVNSMREWGEARREWGAQCQRLYV
jgi:hypothetical protein